MYMYTECPGCKEPQINCTCPKGQYWDHVTQEFYTWPELKILHNERKGIHQQNPQEVT